jgi:hypothetical protein
MLIEVPIQPLDAFAPINVIFSPHLIKQRSLVLQKKDHAKNYSYRIHHPRWCY